MNRRGYVTYKRGPGKGVVYEVLGDNDDSRGTWIDEGPRLLIRRVGSDGLAHKVPVGDIRYLTPLELLALEAPDA
jgi:hypothetical protein